MRSGRAPRAPRRPRRATLWGVAGPFLKIAAGFVVFVLLLGFAFLLTPSPELRDPVHRMILLNRSERSLARLEARREGIARDAPAEIVGTCPDVADGARWIVEVPLGDEGWLDLAFDLDGQRHEYEGLHHLRAWPGEVFTVVVKPGPELTTLRR